MRRGLATFGRQRLYSDKGEKPALTEAPTERNESTSGRRLFCSVTTWMSLPDLTKGLVCVSSRLPRRVWAADGLRSRSATRSASTLPTPVAYVLENELMRTSAPAPGRVGVPRRPRRGVGGSGGPKRAAAVLGRGEAVVEDGSGLSGAMSASRSTWTATADPASSARVAGGGAVRHAFVRLRIAWSHSARTPASSVESMY